MIEEGERRGKQKQKWEEREGKRRIRMGGA
jgi:hypothetical protein